MAAPGDDGPHDSGPHDSGPHDSGKVTPLRPRRACPECARPSARETYPFCSPRCKDIDLNRWLSGSYVIPGTEEEGGEDAPATGNPDSRD